jgi:hypothetical protein
MIDSLDALIQYTERVAQASPLIARRVQITRPGCEPDTIAVLRKAFPGLPDSYTSVLESIAIDGISIGYFNLTPGRSRASLVDELRAHNDPTITPMAEVYRQCGVYQVASFEADPICVAHREGPFEIGQIVKYDDVLPTKMPVVLADSFEQLLLIAGNLQEIRGNHKEPSQAIREFGRYLAPMVAGRQDGVEAAWMQVADVTLR